MIDSIFMPVCVEREMTRAAIRRSWSKLMTYESLARVTPTSARVNG